MTTTATVEIGLLAVLLALSAFFSATEISLFVLGKLQVRRLRQSNPRGQLISELLDRPQRLLSAILFGNTIVNIAFAVLGYHLWQQWVPHADLLAVPSLTLLLLIG